jgi:deazaflavin-dependent oxidoreductase (nitroreductase family)
MSESGLKNASERSMEIELTVTGRKSGEEISRPVWFVYDDNSLYLLPVQGSNTSWYKNILSNSVVKISVNGLQFNGISRPIIDSDKVKKIVNKFISKYGESEVNKYYTKFDVCVEFLLQ